MTEFVTFYSNQEISFLEFFSAEQIVRVLKYIVFICNAVKNQFTKAHSQKHFLRNCCVLRFDRIVTRNWIIRIVIAQSHEIKINSAIEKTYIKTTKIFAQCGECRVVNVAAGRKLFKRLRKEKKKMKWYFVLKIAFTYLLWEKIVLVIKKSFWNSRL